MKNIDMENILFDVKKAALKAGEAVMDLYGKDYKTQEKTPGGPVTEADLLSNKLILTSLEKYGFGILSEELADSDARLSREYVWIVDPLDGTMDFIDQTGEFTIMIGLARGGKPALGVVYQPATETMYYAVKNKGAFSEQQGGQAVRLAVADKNNFNEATILMSRFHNSKDILAMIETLKIKNEFACGSAGLKFCKIAAGDADININTSNKTSEWDICAAHIILAEAGGHLSDIDGKEFVYNRKNPRNLRGYIASNNKLHGQVIKTIKKIHERGSS